MGNKLAVIFITIAFFFSCKESETRYMCDTYSCVESIMGSYDSLEDCSLVCSPKPNTSSVIVTAFLYENCPIAQYMCGPLRNTYRYFCDTLNQDFIFRGFSPNAFSTIASISNFILEYDIPFNVALDYNQNSNEPGVYTQNYLPTVTPEVFIELNGDLVYRGMIDNSYEALGQWAPPTENYLFDVLSSIVNEEEIVYFDTEAVGCFINY